MLLNLFIKNYALIESLRLELKPGLNIFTGETGAGKSIIIESLGLILGERASAQVVRKGSQRCFITAEFDVSRMKKLKKYLDVQGLFENDTLILRREIDVSGKSRAFVNDIPVSLSALFGVGQYLVDVHGQHEHQSLIRSAEQRNLLDSFGGLDGLRQEVSENYQILRELTAQNESRQMSEQERQRLIDLYSFQINEIESSKLAQGEEEEIEQTLPQMKNAEKLRELSNEAYQLLYGSDGSALENLNKAKKLLENINSLSNSLIETAENLNTATYSIEEAANEIQNFAEKLSADPEKLNELLGRQDLISKLKKKYGRDVSEILSYWDKISKELDALTQFDQNRQELEQKIEKQNSKLLKLCAKLTSLRKEAGTKLGADVEKQLKDLGMKKAEFEILIEKDSQVNTHGFDKVEFMFSPNPGEDLKPLKDIASGGEMSRVMLAIKTALANADHVPVLVFDEIDSGIGGPMGQTVGKKLKDLARHNQILCITHLPQIAAFADQHILVEKETKAARTSTNVRILTQLGQLEEIARMLSGEETTLSARQHAQELIEASLVQ